MAPERGDLNENQYLWVRYYSAGLVMAAARQRAAHRRRAGRHRARHGAHSALLSALAR